MESIPMLEEMTIDGLKRFLKQQPETFLSNLNPFFYQDFLMKERNIPLNDFVRESICSNIRQKDRFYQYIRNGKAIGIASLRELDWDSEVLELPCGWIPWFLYAAGSPKEDVGMFFNELLAQAQRFDFLSVRLSSNDVGTISLLKENAFQAVDHSRVFLSRKGEMKGNQTFHPSMGIHEFNPKEDADFIESLAADSFTTGRFFHDERIPIEKASQLYRKLARSYSSENETSVIRVLRINGEHAGFWLGAIDAAMSNLLGIPYGFLCLIALLPEHQGKGIGKLLMQDFLQEFPKQASLIEICTQSENRSAIKLYLDSGCEQVSSYTTLHYWKGK